MGVTASMAGWRKLEIFGLLLTYMNYKDAYDIYYCLKQYSDRLDDLVVEFRPPLDNALIQVGLKKLAKNFASEEHTGPKFVADFDEITDEEDRL